MPKFPVLFFADGKAQFACFSHVAAYDEKSKMHAHPAVTNRYYRSSYA